MKKPDTPTNEIERLRTLKSLGLLDSLADDMFDNVTSIAQHMFQVPIAVVSLVDENRQWFKSCLGLDGTETSRDISFCGHAILDNKTFVINDALSDERFADNPLVLNAPHIRFYAGQPIKAPNGNLLGTLCIIDTKPRTFSEEQILLLQKCASLIEREVEVSYLSSMDPLTGASNRRGLMLIANHELTRSIRLQSNLSIALFDFDNFKHINDSFGHIAGDRALKEFVSIIKPMLRQSDVFGRMGGDEFAIFMSDTNEQQANDLIKRIQDKFNQVNQHSDRGFPISFTYGLLSLVPTQEDSLHDLLGLTDSLMFKKKMASIAPTM